MLQMLHEKPVFCVVLANVTFCRFPLCRRCGYSTIVTVNLLRWVESVVLWGNMANPESLKPFQKGNDPRRNTKGRPLGAISIKTQIGELLRKKAHSKVWESKDITHLDLLIDKLFHKAIEEKNVSVAKFIIEQLEGKPGTSSGVTLAYLEQGPYLYNLPSNLDPADLEDPEIRALLLQQEKEVKELLVKKKIITSVNS